MHLLIKQKQTHKQIKQIYGYREGMRGGINQEFGINSHIAIYIIDKHQGPNCRAQETVFNILQYTIKQKVIFRKNMNMFMLMYNGITLLCTGN